MAELFIITADFGKWEDYRETELYATVDEDEAYAKLVSLKIEFTAVFAEAQDRVAHGGGWELEGPMASDPIWEVAKYVYHDDDGLTLSLHRMVLGQTTKGKERLERVTMEFTPVDYYTPQEYDRLQETTYETLAAPFETRWHGWRIH